MSFQRLKLGIIVFAVAISLVGCFYRKDPQQLHYLGPEGPGYYKDIATSIEYSNTEAEIPDQISRTAPPRTIADRTKDQIWDLSLAEALQLALSNNRVIRVAGQFTAPGNSLMATPNNVPSAFDSAIQESGVLLGGRGVEAALADFDAQFTTTFNAGQNQTVQNNAALSGGVRPGNVLDIYTGTYNSTLQKTFANGGTAQFQNVWNYSAVNQPVLFPSSYNGYAQFSYSQPLWAGSGTEFTRIATPLGSGLSGVSGVSQGVAIARINEDMAIADFELSVLNLLRDTENTYWNLYLQYRLYRAAVVAHDSALRSWREAEAKRAVGGAPGYSAVDEPQSRDQMYNTRASAEQALSNLYTAETNLRRLLGLPVNDGKILRPSDEPLTARFTPDWYNSLTEGLTRRVELRKQKWAVKSFELQLKAAKSLTNPQLNLTGSYRINAFGNDLISQQSQITAPYSSAFASLAEAGQQGWNVGFTFFMPIGFRQAHAQVRNYELRVSKARQALAEQEMEVAQELAVSFQNVAADYQTAQSNFNRRVAAEQASKLYEEQYKVGTTTLAFVLQSQSSLAQAEQNYYTSLVNYAEAIMDLNYRKGTLLDYHNVTLAESDWTPEAYKDAVRDAWARSHAFDANFLCTAPPEQQLPHGSMTDEHESPAGGVSPAPASVPISSDGVLIPPAPPVEQTPTSSAAPTGPSMVPPTP